VAEPVVAPAAATGNIYDLGYRGYDGPRLGRRHAIRALFSSSLRSAFGIGRGGRAKIAPFSIAVFAMLPALVAVGIDALVARIGADEGPGPGGLQSPIQYGTYLGLTSTLLILFCAAQAPELVGRDQRHRVLVLYFSRALERIDYVVAKVAALTMALFLVLAAPLLLMFVGRVLSASDVPAALVSNGGEVAPALFVVPAAALLLATLSLAVASLTPRRAYATAGIIALFIIPPILIALVTEIVRGDATRYSVLFGVGQVLDGLNAFAFGRAPGDELVREARLPGLAYVAAAVAMVAAALAVLIRRYQRIDA
jgi:ABC-2 type transport system permease protein